MIAKLRRLLLTLRIKIADRFLTERYLLKWRIKSVFGQPCPHCDAFRPRWHWLDRKLYKHQCCYYAQLDKAYEGSYGRPK